MFGIGGFELFLILIFGFLIFGPDKLPEIAKTVGRAIAKFRGAQESMTEQLKDVTLIDKDSDNPLKNPLDVLNNATSKGSSSKSEKATTKSANVDKAGASADKPASDAEVKRADSFAERKARYDRERAERKRAEAEAAKKAEQQAADKAAAKKEAAENPKIDIAAKSLKEEGE